VSPDGPAWRGNRWGYAHAQSSSGRRRIRRIACGDRLDLSVARVWDRDVRGCSRRIGIGPPPLRTEHGWLIIYHGVKDTVSGALYRVGIALADLAEPTRVTHRLPGWIFGPDAHYERTGDVPNAVFPCGLVHDEQTGELRLYYGAADTTVALASAQFDEVLAAVLAAPV
jgi:predicted GH43/DUF377 family glycosyl hydrolase